VGSPERAMSGFETTRWSLVINARAGDAQAAAALADLCARYRAPVLAYVRQAGYVIADAEDLTQAFFVQFLEKRGDLAADPLRGKFRQLLRVQLRHFLIDTRTSELALKRTGTTMQLSLDVIDTLADPSLPPEQDFDRRFALGVVERALGRLRTQLHGDARLVLFDALSPVLFEPRDQGALKVIAQAHGMRVNTLAVTLKRMRDRLAISIRAELSDLIADPAMLDAEVRALRSALRSS